MLDYMKAKGKKYKGKGGNNQFCIKRNKIRKEKKELRKQNRIDHNKFPKDNTKHYLVTFKANISEKDIEFAKLQQIKLVDKISIYSHTDQIGRIEKLFYNKLCLPKEFEEIKFLKYSFDSIENISSNKNLRDIRKLSFYEIEQNPNNKERYNCYTTEKYLNYLFNKYRTQGYLFSEKDKKKKTYLLTKVSEYNALIKKGNVLVTDFFLANKCLKLRESKGHRIEFIYDKNLLPHTVTKYKNKRICKYPSKRLSQEDIINESLVCITDGISVHRLKFKKANKIVGRFPSKIKFCDKSTYHKYLDQLNGHLPKDKRELARKLSIQGDSKNPKDTRTRSDRRSVNRKEKFYSRDIIRQQVPYNEDHPDTTNCTIITKKSKPSYKTRKPHKESYYHDRLMKTYHKTFKHLDRRGKFSPSEKWSTQFMIILSMIKQGKRERDVAKYISECLPGWNDKTIKRFIIYLKLTKQGINYKANKKTVPLQRYKKETKKFHGIKINQFPYNKEITIDYETKSEEGGIKFVVEQNVTISGKKLVKFDKELNEEKVICNINNVRKWVEQEKYSDTPECKWVNLIDIVPYEKEVVVKIPFKLTKKIKMKKTWKHVIESDKERFNRYYKVLERKINNEKQHEVAPYITKIVKTMPFSRIRSFAIAISNTHIRNIVQDRMLQYADERYINTPEAEFLVNMLPF